MQVQFLVPGLVALSLAHATADARESAMAADLTSYREALRIIGDFSENLCANVPLEGSAERVELSGQAKAELNSLIQKLVDLGIEGSARYASDEYKGVLQEDLADLIRSSQDCRLRVWDDLKDRLLPDAQNIGEIRSDVPDSVDIVENIVPASDEHLALAVNKESGYYPIHTEILLYTKPIPLVNMAEFWKEECDFHCLTLRIQDRVVYVGEGNIVGEMAAADIRATEVNNVIVTRFLMRWPTLQLEYSDDHKIKEAKELCVSLVCDARGGPDCPRILDSVEGVEVIWFTWGVKLFEAGTRSPEPRGPAWEGFITQPYCVALENEMQRIFSILSQGGAQSRRG